MIPIIHVTEINCHDSYLTAGGGEEFPTQPWVYWLNGTVTFDI